MIDSLISSKLTCIVIEDEPLALKKIVEYIQMFPNLSIIKTIKDIEDPAGFVQELKSADVLFLDLIVSGGKIEKLADHITEIPYLVVTSAISRWEYPDFVKERNHYALQKPISPEMFKNCIHQMMNLIE